MLAVKVWLQWASAQAAAARAWGGALWAAVAHVCGQLAPRAHTGDTCEYARVRRVYSLCITYFFIYIHSVVCS